MFGMFILLRDLIGIRLTFVNMYLMKLINWYFMEWNNVYLKCGLIDAWNVHLSNLIGIRLTFINMYLTKLINGYFMEWNNVYLKVG